LRSETCAPLYPPHVIYLQLLSEVKSRLNACAPPDGGAVERWNSALYIPGVLGPQRWRKSSQVGLRAGRGWNHASSSWFVCFQFVVCAVLGEGELTGRPVL
jgi:hypothetical protein